MVVVERAAEVLVVEVVVAEVSYIQSHSSVCLLFFFCYLTFCLPSILLGLFFSFLKLGGLYSKK